ncbi:MAG: glucosamine-6-phosphate deaminase [Erysipelotrichaceae bacterium]|jgi:glucosamine-6-phosphate deaminase|nr:glucosamine-6-phosphate deaminase [Erysipelotrichaceae bacterium]MCR5095601.1 glucosamine-6-phosphate deaminase [Erysipelotrichaceae bacterium]
MFNVIKVKDYEEASDKAFEVMKDFIKPGKVLGLATGSTPIGLYQRMVKDHEENGTSYKEIKTFNLDEYVGLPISHPESYYAFMHRNLFDHIDIPEENTHVPSGLGEDLEAQAAAYDAMIAKDPVDIQLLGIGSDGHIAFNEPGTAFDSPTHVTDLAESTIKDNCRFFDNDISKVPTQAVTQGIGTIMKAKNILLIATGANKAQAVKDMINGPVDETCPASILQKHDNVTIIVDEAAASLL